VLWSLAGVLEQLGRRARYGRHTAAGATERPCRELQTPNPNIKEHRTLCVQWHASSKQRGIKAEPRITGTRTQERPILRYCASGPVFQASLALQPIQGAASL
jgi:hypothetical protein